MTAWYRDPDTGAAVVTRPTRPCSLCGGPKERQNTPERKPFCDACRRLRQRLRRVGLTRSEYDELMAKHDGRCHNCKINPATAIDHCHTTMVVRGVVCNSCNLLLGWMEKVGKEGTSAAMNYLGWDE